MLGWDALEKECAGCRKCALAQRRTNVVFGVGSRQAEIMIVGEGPGEQEDLKGEPFVGRAGQLLDRYLYAVGLDRTNTYIANIVKCRPPGNRDPEPEERESCLPYLRNQVFLIQPKIIVCAGRIAAATVIKPDFRITRERGVWFEKKGTFFMAVYHPAYLLRNPSAKIDTLRDFYAIGDKLRQMRERTVFIDE